MTTLPELLRDADPLRHEPHRTSEERRARREALLESVPASDEVSRRRLLVQMVAALIVVAAAAGIRYGSRPVAAAVRFEVRLAEEAPAEGLREAVVAGTGRTIYLHPDAVVMNGDIEEAVVTQAENASTFSVTVTLNDDAAARLFKSTQNHVGRPVAILVDGEVVLAPVVRSAIGDTAVITGNYTREEAVRIAVGIVGR